MPTATNLMLSAEEQFLVNKTDWILMKRDILGKVVSLLSSFSVTVEPVFKGGKDFLPEEILRSEPRISKGENYLGLPYVLLDHPKYFDKENIFTIRTLFWWGNFFSITLHLSGSFTKRFQGPFLRNTALLQKEGLFFCIGDDQWQHHFDTSNYLTATELDREELNQLLVQRSFIKVARKFSLTEWNVMPVLLERSFSELLKLLQ